jgi:hypothetical protein
VCGFSRGMEPLEAGIPDRKVSKVGWQHRHFELVAFGWESGGSLLETERLAVLEWKTEAPS